MRTRSPCGESAALKALFQFSGGARKSARCGSRFVAIGAVQHRCRYWPIQASFVGLEQPERDPDVLVFPLLATPLLAT
jgi:hypothetical protein